MKFNKIEFNKLIDAFYDARNEVVSEIAEMAISLNHPQLDFSSVRISGQNAVIDFNCRHYTETVIIVIELSKFSPDYLSAYIDGFLANH